jgi:hypothetical protein
MNFENFKDTVINEIEVKKDLDNTDKNLEFMLSILKILTTSL